MRISFSKNSWFSIAGVILILAAWEILSLVIGSENILPGPIYTLKTLILFLGDIYFYKSLFLTLLRGLTGFVLAMIASLLVGIPSGINSKTESFFSPLIVTIRSTPVISVILLAIIWLRVENVPVFIGFLTMFPILTTSIITGIREVDRGLVEMALIYRVKKLRLLKDIYIPSLSPYFFSGLLTAAGFGWRAVIIGEVLSQPRYGIGSMMQNSQTYLLVAELISWTMVAVLVGFVFEKVIEMGRSKLTAWK
jgi:NitT/TauT family transport system permease protein